MISSLIRAFNLPESLSVQVVSWSDLNQDFFLWKNELYCHDQNWPNENIAKTSDGMNWSLVTNSKLNVIYIPSAYDENMTMVNADTVVSIKYNIINTQNSSQNYYTLMYTKDYKNFYDTNASRYYNGTPTIIFDGTHYLCNVFINRNMCIIMSTDGINWTELTQYRLPDASGLYYVFSYTNGKYILSLNGSTLISYDTYTDFLAKTNGTTYNTLNFDSMNFGTILSYWRDKYIFITNTNFKYSFDLINWNTVSVSDFISLPQYGLNKPEYMDTTKYTKFVRGYRISGQYIIIAISLTSVLDTSINFTKYYLVNFALKVKEINLHPNFPEDLNIRPTGSHYLFNNKFVYYNNALKSFDFNPFEFMLT